MGLLFAQTLPVPVRERRKCGFIVDAADDRVEPAVWEEVVRSREMEGGVLEDVQRDAHRCLELMWVRGDYTPSEI